MEHMYDIQMTYSRYKTLLHCQQQQTPPPVSPTVSPSHRFHCWVSPALFFFFFSCSTTGFKFFQTSVAFHRGMAVQHKAESRHAPSNQTAEALPGNRACSGTPTHWGLSSAVTFSGSHLVSPWKKKRGKKTTSTHFQENLDFWDVSSALTSRIRSRRVLFLLCFSPIPSLPFFFFHPERLLSPYSPSIGFFSPPPLLLLDNSWIRLMYSSLSSPRWVFYLFAFRAGDSSRANTHRPFFFFQFRNFTVTRSSLSIFFLHFDYLPTLLFSVSRINMFSLSFETH